MRTRQHRRSLLTSQMASPHRRMESAWPRRGKVVLCAIVGSALLATAALAQQVNTSDGTTRTTADSAFQLYWDSAADLWKFRCAPSDTAGSAITWTDGPTLNTSCAMSGVSASASAANPDRGIQFNSGGSFAADSNFVFTSAGRLGIGVTAPDSALHIYRPDLGWRGGIYLKDTGSSFTITRQWIDATAHIISGSGPIGFSPGSTVTSGSSDPIPTVVFLTNGNVGIGTTNPGAKLEIIDPNGEGLRSTRYSSVVFDADAAMLVRRARNTEASPNIVQSGDSLGAFMFAGYDGATFRNSAAINAFVDGTPGSGDMPTRLEFLVTPDGSATRATAMTIDSTGNVGIGITTPQSTLHVPDGKYLQAEDNNAGAPPAGDCDADAERGRISIDTSNNRLYVCMGATRGWDYAALTD